MIKTTKRALDRVGKVYHELTVVELVGRNKYSQLMWKCLCSCGNYKTLPSGELGRTKSCGCLKKGSNKNSSHPSHATGPDSPYWTGTGEISGYKWNKIKASAKKRSLSFDISIQEAWELFMRQNRICALSGLTLEFGKKSRELGTASLDRIDSKKGYTTDNIQWVHKDINKMKMDLDEERLLLLCEKIYKKNLTKLE
jgi:hypothetical protein